MLESEENIQNGCNDVGKIATSILLKNFDTDGTNIILGKTILYSKGLEKCDYKTPYGKVSTERHLYQNSLGGETYCPLESSARIVGSATPKLAKIMAHKHTKLSTRDVQTDLLQNHSLSLTKEYISQTSELIASFAKSKEDTWLYCIPKIDDTVHSISIGIDGTCMYLLEENTKGYREAMVGTISLQNKEGVRLHTNYLAESPEYGKNEFFERMGKEIQKTNIAYPLAIKVGLADGAQSNWNYLIPKTDIQISDFWHVTEYLKGACTAMQRITDKEKWLDEKCHNLKHNDGAAFIILKELEEYINLYSPIGEQREKIEKAVTYFTNQMPRMNYSEYIKKGFSIGSGVTEAACKTVVKQRLCKSGMRWKKKGASAILNLRCIDLSDRWGQFWDKISQFGFAA
jgi:hypothetical protein